MSEERDILANRKAKMDGWRADTGIYPNDFRRQDLAVDLHQQAKDLDKPQLVEAAIETAVAGSYYAAPSNGQSQLFNYPRQLGSNAMLLDEE